MNDDAARKEIEEDASKDLDLEAGDAEQVRGGAVDAFAYFNDPKPTNPPPKTK